MISPIAYVCHYCDIQYCIYLFWWFLACKCNSKGTFSNRNTVYIYQRDNTACNNDSCACISGYSGNDCNSCDNGYVVTDTENGENMCEPGKNAIMMLN